MDRLTKCVEFLLSNDGRVLKTQVLSGRDPFAAPLHLPGSASRILQRKPRGSHRADAARRATSWPRSIRRARFKAGSLDLDFPETKIRLDEHGRVLRIEKVENDVSHQLIEEYMLLANEAVAARLMSLSRPARLPRPRAAGRAAAAGIPRGGAEPQHPVRQPAQPAEVQKLLQKLDTLPIGPALKIGFLKSLMRARYAVEPLGHYGLAKKKYTHFTSPIRRYADLVVHRALFQQPGHGSPPTRSRKSPNTSPTPNATPPTPSATART